MKSCCVCEEIDFHCVLCCLTVSGSYIFIMLYCFFWTKPPSIHFVADTGLLVRMHLTNRDNLQINTSLQCLHRHTFANIRLCASYSLLKERLYACKPHIKDIQKDHFRLKGAYNCRHMIIQMSHICNRVEKWTERRICLNCCQDRTGEVLTLLAMLLKQCDIQTTHSYHQWLEHFLGCWLACLYEP